MWKSPTMSILLSSRQKALLGSALISTTGPTQSAEIQMWEGMAAKGQEAPKAPEDKHVRALHLGWFLTLALTVWSHFRKATRVRAPSGSSSACPARPTSRRCSGSRSTERARSTPRRPARTGRTPAGRLPRRPLPPGHRLQRVQTLLRRAMLEAMVSGIL